MSRNYLIGIGGTGARVIEAVVNLCAAGFGPDELSVFLVDPDAGNGNLTRTKTHITNYIKCRKSLQRLPDTKIFRTLIKIPPDEKGLVWEIFDEKGTTLSSYINYTNMNKTRPELAGLASLLFSDNELETELNEGFRGHPAIGAVVMSDLKTDVYPFKMLFDDLADNKKANDVRVFFVGSVFGGTGAAGFPTFGSKQILKFHPSAKLDENVSQVLLGGALVLPYFSFELDTEAEKRERMFVNTSDFPIATKAALQYYNEKDLGFDQIYFIGDSLAQKVGKFGVGSKAQQNFPHYIEVVSALASFDFFDQPEIKGETEKMLFTAIRDSDPVGFNDLPISREADSIRTRQQEMKKLVTNMTLFSYSYMTYGEKILAQPHREIKDAWYKDYFSFNDKDEKEKIKDPRHSTNSSILEDFSKFLGDYLFWIAAMDDPSGKVSLVDRSRIFNGDLQIGKKVSFLKSEKGDNLLKDPEDHGNLMNISLLIKNQASRQSDFNEFKTRGLNAVENLNKSITEASSKFLHLFYEGGARFAKLIYNI